MLTDLPLILITKIYKNFLKKQQKLHEYGLTEQQIVFLMVIFKSEDGIRLTDLTERLGVDKSNTTRIIRQLEDKGYAVKDLSSCRRKYPILLTASGKELAAVIAEKETEQVSKVLADFTQSELETIEKLLKIISSEEWGE